MRDADAIHAEVERRRERARSLGLPEAALVFAEAYARTWPVWSQSHPEMIPPGVRDVRGGADLMSPSLSFMYAERHFEIRFQRDCHSDSDGDPYWWGSSPSQSTGALSWG